MQARADRSSSVQNGNVTKSGSLVPGFSEALGHTPATWCKTDIEEMYQIALEFNKPVQATAKTIT